MSKRNKPIKQLTSHSPLVKRTTLSKAKEELSKSRDEIAGLHGRNEEWALEVRALRLEIQRLKEYQKWMGLHYPTAQSLEWELNAARAFNYKPLLTVVLPVYNTFPAYLQACIEAVLAQSYTNWELCIADDASTNLNTVTMLEHYTKLDKRIRVTTLEKNSHISTASNEALKNANGEFVLLLDHDDFLWPNAMFEVVRLLQERPDADFIYADEDKIDEDEPGHAHFAPFFKPGPSIHLLECINYITHLSVIRTSLIRELNGFNDKYVGAQDWDLFLRIFEKTTKIYHIETILYSWRAHEWSTAHSLTVKDYVLKNQESVLRDHFKRIDQPIERFEKNIAVGTWFPRFELQGDPLLSIVIPTKDKADYLKRCIDSVINLTTYKNFEIVIVDTGSIEETTKEYYEVIKATSYSEKIKVVNWQKQPFNYSDACNFGAKHAAGDYLIMLNNDTEILTKDWLQDMLGYAQKDDVGAVGVKLLYPNMRIQHAGVTIGIGSIEPVAGHIGITSDKDSEDYLNRLYIDTVRDSMAVTAACLMVSTKKYWEVGGFDEIFRVTFNDVDLCLKLNKAGYGNIYLPYVQVLHHESISVGRVEVNRDMTELNKSAKLMRERWKDIIDNDPYYNKNFYDLSPNFGLDIFSSKSKAMHIERIKLDQKKLRRA